MNKNNDYGKMLLKYLGKWVALSSDEATVVASGKTLAETMRIAQKTKEKNPIYIMVSTEIGNFSF
ncbi:hypothetical protein A2Y85_02320 [candidate division WOR-3 bacterium RBG_13_43_14]|uniref:DUF5678 domain-containing protein n=1 Tax=candidate division WOR-3 bacterium RBG_13_43_14 TaxID=1802590 RepID=A0A1F4UD68_UNCW3|nr:MAG: hypothetical protein A2Y85_02320 [candidate division WOR-3 bacterium RBG_13_43_14]